jgi:hypothetical protein
MNILNALFHWNNNVAALLAFLEDVGFGFVAYKQRQVKLKGLCMNSVKYNDKVNR